MWAWSPRSAAPARPPPSPRPGSRRSSWAAGSTPPESAAGGQMRLGYNTNGLAHHRLTDAIDLLADEGFESVALTLDAGALDPYDDPSVLARQVAAVRSCLDRR